MSRNLARLSATGADWGEAMHRVDNIIMTGDSSSFRMMKYKLNVSGSLVSYNTFYDNRFSSSWL